VRCKLVCCQTVDIVNTKRDDANCHINGNELDYNVYLFLPRYRRNFSRTLCRTLQLVLWLFLSPGQHNQKHESTVITRTLSRRSGDILCGRPPDL